MKIIALDWGEKRIGVAVYETTLGVPFIRKQIDNNADKFTKLLELFQIENCEKIIIGMPYQKDGTIDKTAMLAQEFTDTLRTKTDISIETIDERFTTKIAKNKMQEAEIKHTKDIKDSLSAVEIINTYLKKCAK